MSQQTASNRIVQMFAERFIAYTQTVEDVRGTVLDRVVKLATDIPGLNIVSIAVHAFATDKCVQFITALQYFVCSAEVLLINITVLKCCCYNITVLHGCTTDTLFSKNVKEMIKGAAKSFLVTTGM